MQQNELTDPKIWQYALDHTKDSSPRLIALKEETYASVSGAQMLSETLVVKVLQFFIRLQKPKRCVDVGTYTGLSALAMAEVTDSDTVIYTLDKKNQAGHKLAKKHIEKNGFEDKVKFLIGEAKESISLLPDDLDFIFIDADKKQTKVYFDLLLPKLQTGGLIIVDDVLWRKEVLNPEDKRAKALDEFNKYIASHPEVDNMLLPIRHGLNIIYKK